VSRLNVAPTKSNQLDLKRDLAMATEGFNLLEQKREILVMELMRLLDRVRSAQAEVRQCRERAYATLRQAVAHNGSQRLRSVAGGIHYEHRVRTSTHVVAGVRVPEIEVEHGKFHSQFGFGGTDTLTDDTMAQFLELLGAVGKLAELETAAWLLARELRKTQRRVNALEQIFIPDFEDTLNYIGETLESKDLEAFFVMKMVKKKKSRR
jgi:V/A-type H+-transporting ATPase subunit D